MWNRLARGLTSIGDGRFRAIYVDRLARPDGLVGHLAARAMVESNTDLVRAVVDRLDLHDGERALEVGSGPGQGVDAALDAADIVLHAVDPSAAMLARTRRRHRRAVRRLRLHLHQGVLLDLELLVPLQAAWGVNVIAFMDDRVANFAHLRGMLEPGGRLALGYTELAAREDDDVGRAFARTHHPPTAREVADDLSTAGFVDVVTTDHDAARRITTARRP